MRVTVDDADTGDTNGIVRDNDLALLVNGLWSAGAEAICVNGQRLTVMSSIRTSGRAIEVNSVGIAPPYTVLAIGDRGAAPGQLLRHDERAGLRRADPRATACAFDMDNEDRISLPSAPNQLLRLRSVRAGVEGEDHEPAPGEEPE